MDEPLAYVPRIHAPDEAWLARAQPEPVLDPGLAIVDAHMHLWQYDGHPYYLAQYARDAAACGHRVEASVFVECYGMYRSEGPEHLRPVGETEFVAALAAQAPEHTPVRVAAAIVAHADLTQDGETQEALEAHLAAGDGRLRGIRHGGKWDEDVRVRGMHCAKGPGLYLDPAFGRGIDLLTRFGLSFDASVFHPQIPEVAALARAHPDANIVLIHSGSPVGHGPYAGDQAQVRAAWLAGMKELAACDNVCVKLGGLLINLANFHFMAAPRPPTSQELAQWWRPYIEPCLELFGPERCMVSSNFPVDKAGFGYGTLWNMFKHITAGLSESQRQQVFSGTAKRVYRLE